MKLTERFEELPKFCRELAALMRTDQPKWGANGVEPGVPGEQ